jgi:radical SAM superfamily enzyme YgiQ (UPF0313 family)
MGCIAALTPPDWQIEFLDENFVEFTPRSADLVAITAMTIQANRAYQISNVYRNIGVPVVLGGIHPSVLPEEALNYATSVVVGEAEGLWPRVISDFSNGVLKPLYQSDSRVTLQNIVIPRRDIFSRKYVFDCIQTSRGCPFTCDFCSVPVLNGRTYRFRPTEEVVEELKTIKKKFVFFVDDNIVGYGKKSEERAIDLFEKILRSGIKKYWISQASLNVADNEELLRLMKRTGCLGLLIGFESLDRTTLREAGKLHNLRKGITPEAVYLDVISKMHKHGIAVDGYLCCGYEDTQQTIIESMNFALRSGIDIINNPILIPSPGTLLYKKLCDKLDFTNYPSDWNKYLSRLVYSPKAVSKVEFYKAYILSSLRINSLKEAIKRGLISLRWSRDVFQSLMILLFNLGYRRKRLRSLSVLRKEDPDFRAADDELKKRHI